VELIHYSRFGPNSSIQVSLESPKLSLVIVTGVTNKQKTPVVSMRPLKRTTGLYVRILKCATSLPRRCALSDDLFKGMLALQKRKQVSARPAVLQRIHFVRTSGLQAACLQEKLQSGKHTITEDSLEEGSRLC
jgi:hypothetical protein